MSLSPSTQVRLEHQLDSLFLLIQGLPASRLQQSSKEGKWSILENMAHLARYQELFIQRLDLMMLQELPGLPAYRAEKDPAWKMIWLPADQNVVARHLKETRTTLINLIGTYSPQQLKRTGFHAKLGEMNVVEWIEFFLLHEAHHLYTILQIRQAG